MGAQHAVRSLIPAHAGGYNLPARPECKLHALRVKLTTRCEPFPIEFMPVMGSTWIVSRWGRSTRDGGLEWPWLNVPDLEDGVEVSGPGEGIGLGGWAGQQAPLLDSRDWRSGLGKIPCQDLGKCNPVCSSAISKRKGKVAHVKELP